MARTPSNTELPLGTLCPAFELPDSISGKAYGRDDIFAGPEDPRSGLLVAFLSVHCPFVQHMEQAFSTLLLEFADQIATVAICSNTLTTPEDAPAHMRAQALRLHWAADQHNPVIPYLIDESQETAREFHAACTPDLYLFNAQYELVYHAQFDATRPYRTSDEKAGIERHPQIHKPAHGADLLRAIENLTVGHPPLQDQKPSLGCNIKWHAQ